jgi:ubiquinone/menaquinone biosynthesis C-methylase UbiE
MSEQYTPGLAAKATAFMAVRSFITHGEFIRPYIKPGMRALDCGCVPGAMSEGLAEALGLNGQVVGIDFGESQIQIANTRATPNLTFRVASVYELPFEDSSFEAVATPEVVKAMQEHLSPERIENFWRRLFPGQIPDRLLVAEPLEDEELEGHKLVAVNAGRTDTAPSTCLYVPSIGLIVDGDAVYNGIHPHLSETDTQSRLEWISTLDKLEATK